MTAYNNDEASRQAVLGALQSLLDSGLTSGTSGNVSVQTDAGMLITPTGVAPKNLRHEYIVAMSLDGTPATGQLLPSCEWRMHADIYRNKPGVNAVVHCHSNYATILACAHKPIPAQHYMVAAAGSHEIPLAPYASFGSQALSDANLGALTHAKACLLANHGQLTTGPDLDSALVLAGLVEEQAFWYWGVLAIGQPQVLDSEQMDEVKGLFASYGPQTAVDQK
jgi:L-fuculose-phosphate aldolase